MTGLGGYCYLFLDLLGLTEQSLDKIIKACSESTGSTSACQGTSELWELTFQTVGVQCFWKSDTSVQLSRKTEYIFPHLLHWRVMVKLFGKVLFKSYKPRRFLPYCKVTIVMNHHTLQIPTDPNSARYLSTCLTLSTWLVPLIWVRLAISEFCWFGARGSVYKKRNMTKGVSACMFIVWLIWFVTKPRLWIFRYYLSPFFFLNVR